MAAKSYDIVGYTYNADNYCPSCIVDELPTGPDQAFDGWRLADGIRMSTEANLNEIASAFGINRTDEESFDSSQFPKVIFRDMMRWNEPSDICGRCAIAFED